MMPPPMPPKPNKIPTWVWVLTVCGVLFMVGLYGAAYWGFTKVQDMLKTDLAQANPEFEMLHFVTDGKIKVRHKPSGREFVILAPTAGSKIPLLQLATKEVTPVPGWLKLKDAAPNAEVKGWDRAGDTGMLIESIEDLLLDHDLETSVGDESTLTACNAKLLQCVVIHCGQLDDKGNRSWYSATFFTTP